MKLGKTYGWRQATTAVLLAIGLATVAAGPGARATEAPEVRSIEHREGGLVVRVSVPPGVARVVLESCSRGDLKAWVPRAVARVAAGEREVVFTLTKAGGMELLRARADTTDPLPAAFYTGRTNFPVTPADGNMAARAVGGPVFEDALVPQAGDGGAARSVVESDIWAVRENTLYFFNQMRGLQVIDVANPDAPVLRGTLPLPGAGEQMYVPDDRHALLLIHDPCRQWGSDAESAVVVVDTAVEPPVEVARVPLRGRIVESRLVGTALYVASETWKLVGDAQGSWESGTVVTGIDMAQPAKPEVKSTEWFAGSGNVVTATDRFLFVAMTDYTTTWPWRSNLQILDISAPDGTVKPFTRIPMAGRVPDKFKIDMLGDVLRVVVESIESPDTWRFVTVLETYRLSDPRAAAPFAYAKLDRLELARGERLFGTRFDGARGYIVTFQRIDPLWVIDLSDPADIKIAGELEIPGWSTYLRPMGDRLLTMGIDNTKGWRVAVQLFDVSNPAKPTLLAKVPLGEDASWSEANNDEKAFGVVPEAGLLLVPISSWGKQTLEHGVQLIDLGRDSLTKRGLLESDAVVPRRAAWHHERVLTVSGRQLIAADASDRDHPRVSATIELAYPVERVVATGGHLIEFQSGAMRVRPVSAGPDAIPAPVTLDDLAVLGATVRGTRLHLLQGRPAEVVGEYDEKQAVWMTRTNSGTLVASVWDTAALPKLTKLGATKAPTDRTWLADAEPLSLGDDLLVWAFSGSGWPVWGRWLDVGPVPGGGRFAGGDVFWPWWNESPRSLVAVQVDAGGQPAIVSDVLAGEAGQSTGQVLASGRLILATRQIHESEVVGTNLVVENAWFPTKPTYETNVFKLPDGTLGSNVVEQAQGEFRTVTNSYPVLRWWSRHELDAIDYSADPANPARRPAIPAPGALQGVARDASLLYTTTSRARAENESPITYLEASAYDGVTMHLVDSVAIADHGVGETYAMTALDGQAYVARGAWGTDSTQRLEVWDVSTDGKWRKGATAKLGGVPSEVRCFHDLLLVRQSAGNDLFLLANPDLPAPLPVVEPPGCYGGQANRADGDAAHGLWLPLWDYGAFRLGPGQ